MIIQANEHNRCVHGRHISPRIDCAECKAWRENGGLVAELAVMPRTNTDECHDRKGCLTCPPLDVVPLKPSVQ